MQYNQKYIHLRCRSSYSLAQGAIKIDDLIELAKDYSMPALALTDNGNLFGALEFSIKAAKNGIQPIIGSILEIEIKSNDSQYDDANKCKILLLVKNTNGWKNLSYLISKSFIDNIDGLQAPI
ncbi:MAG: PHP domain-containing protein, partial [Alphaproteobacteria bacterium]